MKKGILIKFNPNVSGGGQELTRRSEFERIQDLLIDLRAQLLVPCESSEEGESLLIASHFIMTGLRSRIMTALHTQSMPQNALRELMAVFSLVWIRAVRISEESGSTVFRVIDIPPFLR